MNKRLESLKVDIDTRVMPLWAVVWETPLDELMDDDDRDLFAACLRAAYGLGYRDALREDDEGRRGDLARANGYTKGEA